MAFINFKQGMLIRRTVWGYGKTIMDGPALILSPVQNYLSRNEWYFSAALLLSNGTILELVGASAADVCWEILSEEP